MGAVAGAALGTVGSIAGGIAGQQAGGGDLGESRNQANIANQILQQIQSVPDISKPLVLQQYKQAGILTPQMEATITAQIPAAIGQDTQARAAQQQALQQMQQRAAGGLTAADRAALQQAQLSAQGDVQSRLASIQQQAAMRGQAGGGAELAAQLAAAQQGANVEAQNAAQLAQQSQAAQQQAAAQLGQFGTQLESQQFGEQFQQQQAQQQMQRFNIQNQLAQQQRNVAAANQAQASNLANLQSIQNANVSQSNQEQYNQLQRQMQQYQANVQKAQIQAGGASQLSGQLGQMGRQEAQAASSMWSGLGTGLGGIASAYGSSKGGSSGSSGGSYAGGGDSSSVFAYEGGKIKDYKKGGSIKGQAKVKGDSPKNDTVHARLSPGEIVVPRSLAKTDLGKKLLQLIELQKSKTKGYDEGGEVKDDDDKVKIDPDKAKQVSDSFKSVFNQGGYVPSGFKSKGYQEGGEVDSEESEEPKKVDVGELEGSTVTGATPRKLEDVEEKQSPEDKEMEQQYANEEFQAGEKADESTQPEREVAGEEQPSEEPSEDQKAQNLSGSEEEQHALDRIDEAAKPKNIADDLAEAQRQRRLNIALQQVQRGAALFGAGMAKADPSQALKIIDQQEQYVGLPVKEYEEKIENQQNDPNSEMSNVMRNYLSSKGINISPHASAADMFKVAPYLAKDSALQNALAKTLESLKVKQTEGQLNRESRERIADLQSKQREQMQKAYEERTKAMAGNTQDRIMYGQMQKLTQDLAQGGGQPVNQNRLNLQRSQNLFLTNGVDPKINEQDIDKLPDSRLNKVNRINVIENGIELNRLLAGSGVAAQSTLNKLVPNNINMSATQVQDYISNKLNPAQQAQALKAYMKIAARVRDQSKQNVKDYQMKRLSGSEYLLDRFPENAKNLLMEHDLSRDDLKSRKAETPTPSAPQGGTVTIRRKSDGITKTLPADSAQKYLNDPGFEKVQ